MRPLTAKEIRDLREREGASQAVFARYLNVSTGLVSQWERGEKHPQGASLKTSFSGRKEWFVSCRMNPEKRDYEEEYIAG